MNSELWEKVQDLLFECLELPAGERPAFLERACAGERELRREVESLLATSEVAGDFIEKPLVHLRTAESSEASWIGPYRILDEVGRGGMGTVYRALRSDQDFELQVAIKVVNREKVSDDLLHRFRLERRILASLDHPNIARLLDGGTTGDGLPYLVMQYVEGERIDQYCDSHRLSTSERVRLFLKVCSAIQYAHRSLVIHRDLKPGNILVGSDGEPKLLDFGIAKLLDPEPFTDSSTTVPWVTTVDTQPMTVRYASPEQIRLGTITTASDVYSLGVLLYELLTGHSPYRRSDRSFGELAQAVKEEEPERPSTVIGCEEKLASSDSTEIRLTPDSVSGTRDGDPQTLRRRLSGDLDAILLKALRKEPEERFSSVEQLADDLSRHLEGRPVQARRGTWLYRGSKFARRHRSKFLAAAALYALLLSGFLLVQNQERKTREAFQQLIDVAPETPMPPQAAERLASEIGGYPPRPEFGDMVSDQADELVRKGGFQAAEILSRAALEMIRRAHGDNHPEVSRAMNNLAAILAAQGEYEEAETLYRASLDLRIELHGRRSEEAATAMNNLSTLYQNTQRLDEAEELANESLEIRTELDGPRDLRVAAALNNLTLLLKLKGDFEAAEVRCRQALEIVREHDHTRPQEALVLRNLATVLLAKGEAEQAEEKARQALEIFDQLFGHWQIADAESVLGGCLLAQGHLEAAEFLLTRSYPIVEIAKGPRGRQTLEAWERLEALRRARVRKPAPGSERVPTPSPAPL